MTTRLISIFVSVSALISTSIAFANQQEATATAVCTFDTGGDDFFQVKILEDGLQVSFWESQFTMDASEISYTAGIAHSGVFQISDRQATFFGEGETWTRQVNATLIFDKKAGLMMSALGLDGENPLITTLKCK